MRPPKPFPADTVPRMQKLLKTVRSVADQRRIQAVLMRALDASPPEKIAATTGLSVATVRMIHSRYLRDGESFLVGRPGRGGKRRGYLDPAQAQALLDRYAAGAGEGAMVEAGAFRRDYEALVGHAVAASTVYRLLARAGWRKVAPRPSHPGKDPQSEETFKKSTSI